MNDTTEAHYLHERSGLQPVLRAPVSGATTLAWVPTKARLLVSTTNGEVVSIDPVMGTQVVAKGIGTARALAVHNNAKRYVSLNREGAWRVGDISGATVASGEHGFVGLMDAFFVGDRVVMMGDTTAGREVVIVAQGKEAARIQVPKGVVVTQGSTGKLLALRSTPRGVEARPFGRKTRFSSLPSTAHRLVVQGQFVLGYTEMGLGVWPIGGGAPMTMRFPGMNAGCLSPDGVLVGLGTIDGSVGLARLDSMDKRLQPDLVRASEYAIHRVAFSHRGRWLASIGGSVRLWSWEG